MFRFMLAETAALRQMTRPMLVNADLENNRKGRLTFGHGGATRRVARLCFYIMRADDS